MSVVMIVIAFIAIAAYETPGLVRNKLWKDLVVFAGLVIFGFVISLLQAIGIPVPNPIKGIEYLTEKVARLFR